MFTRRDEATNSPDDADLPRHKLVIASGEKSKSELLGLGDHEFVPWQIGIVG